MITLKEDAIIEVSHALAHQLLVASERLPAFNNQDYYESANQKVVYHKIKQSCFPEFDNLIDQIKVKLKNPPYSVLVKGLLFDQHYRVLVALNSAFGLLVARPFNKETPRAQLIHHIQPQSDIKNNQISDKEKVDCLTAPRKLTEKLHIDGADRPEPIRFVSMQCVRQDTDGEGRSRIMDSHGFKTMLQEDGVSQEFFDLLKSQKVPRKIADYFGGGIRWQTILEEDRICWRRYTFDLALAEKGVKISNEMINLIERIDQLINKNENHVIEFSMNTGDFLIVDNHRCLHARTAITNANTPRLMYRCWIE